MLRYEMLILTVPEITADEANTIESQINSIIDRHEGVSKIQFFQDFRSSFFFCAQML